VQEFVLMRTGEPPLKFRGEVLASADGRWQNGKDQNRWHEITVYRTPGGNHVLEVVYHTLWQGESDHHHVVVTETLQGAISNLKAYDALEHLIGFPPHPQFTEKQARLEESIRQRWQSLMSEVLAAIPEAAEEIA